MTTTRIALTALLAAAIAGPALGCTPAPSDDRPHADATPAEMQPLDHGDHSKVTEAFPAADQELLLTADTFILHTLHPYPYMDEGRPEDGGFHDYKVLGSAEISDRAERRELLEALFRGIAENPGMVAACFNPRHGIEARSGDRRVDIVICFECLSMGIHRPGRDRGSALVTEKTKHTFNRSARAHDLPIHSD